MCIMKCKNIECSNETINKRVYCSLTCRNVYVNKYMRNYDKYSNTMKEKNDIRKIEYLKSPKLCKCGEIIPFSKKENDYCNKSCRATFVNGNRDYSNWTDNIRKGIHNYLIDNGIKTEIEIGNKKCKGCNNLFKRSNKVFCSNECRIQFRRKDMTEFKIYKAETNFKFNLSDYTDMFDFSLIEKYGWYSPSNKKNNLGGVSRDHMLSVKEGFELGIDPKLLSHPANCKLMIHNENVSKNKKSSISLEDLIQRVKYFDEKYG